MQMTEFIINVEPDGIRVYTNDPKTNYSVMLLDPDDTEMTTEPHQKELLFDRQEALQDRIKKMRELAVR